METKNDELNELGALEALRETEPKDADFDPVEGDREAEARKLEAETAKASAGMAVGILSAGLGLVAPGVKVEEEAADNVRDKLAAVLQKYGGGLPPWLAAWKEEIELAGALGLAGFGVYMQIQTAKRQNAKQEAAEHGPESQPQTA